MNEFASDGFGPRNEEERVIYAEESFRVDVQTKINTLMIAKGLTEDDLMKRTGVGDVFSDEAELTIRDLAKVLYAMGEAPTLETKPISPEVGPQLENEEGDTEKREPGCQCHWEEGDSPCPVHDLSEAETTERALCFGCRRGEECSGWFLCATQTLTPAGPGLLAAVLAKVPDVPASPGDELPADTRTASLESGVMTLRQEIHGLTARLAEAKEMAHTWHARVGVKLEEANVSARRITHLESELSKAVESRARLHEQLEASDARCKKAEAMSVSARVALKEDGEMEEKLESAEAKIEALEAKLDEAERKAKVPWKAGQAVDHETCRQTAANFLRRAARAETERDRLARHLKELEAK